MRRIVQTLFALMVIGTLSLGALPGASALDIGADEAQGSSTESLEINPSPVTDIRFTTSVNGAYTSMTHRIDVDFKFDDDKLPATGQYFDLVIPPELSSTDVNIPLIYQGVTVAICGVASVDSAARMRCTFNDYFDQNPGKTNVTGEFHFGILVKQQGGERETQWKIGDVWFPVRIPPIGPSPISGIESALKWAESANEKSKDISWNIVIPGGQIGDDDGGFVITDTFSDNAAFDPSQLNFLIRAELVNKTTGEIVNKTDESFKWFTYVECTDIGTCVADPGIAEYQYTLSAGPEINQFQFRVLSQYAPPTVDDDYAVRYRVGYTLKSVVDLRVCDDKGNPVDICKFTNELKSDKTGMAKTSVTAKFSGGSISMQDGQGSFSLRKLASGADSALADHEFELCYAMVESPEPDYSETAATCFSLESGDWSEDVLATAGLEVRVWEQMDSVPISGHEFEGVKFLAGADELPADAQGRVIFKVQNRESLSILARNTYRERLGGFSVAKSVEGIADVSLLPAEFDFKYTVGDDPVVRELSVVPGESVSVADLPYDSEVTLWEDTDSMEIDGHSFQGVTWSGDGVSLAGEGAVSFTIGESDSDTEVTATNLYQERLGAFRILKATSGLKDGVSPATGVKFLYRVGEGEEVPVELTADDNRGHLVDQVPAGTVVTVREHPDSQVAVGSQEWSEVIFSREQEILEQDENGAIRFKVDEGDPVVVTATNSYLDGLGGFGVGKTVTGLGDIQITDPFTVMYQIEGDVRQIPIELVAGGELHSVADLPAGTRVSLWEDPASMGQQHGQEFAGVSYRVGERTLLPDTGGRVSFTVVENDVLNVVVNNSYGPKALPQELSSFGLAKVTTGLTAQNRLTEPVTLMYQIGTGTPVSVQVTPGGAPMMVENVPPESVITVWEDKESQRAVGKQQFGSVTYKLGSEVLAQVDGKVRFTATADAIPVVTVENAYDSDSERPRTKPLAATGAGGLPLTVIGAAALGGLGWVVLSWRKRRSS